MPFTERDAQAATYLMRRLREETKGAAAWDEQGTYVIACERKGHHLLTTLEHLLRTAADPTARTPGALRRPFTPPSAAPVTDRHRPRCPVDGHASYYADNCGACRTDITLKTPPSTGAIPRGDDSKAAAAAAKAQIKPLGAGRPGGTP